MSQSESNAQKSVVPSSKPRIVTCEGLADFEEHIRKAIAYRAYEIYEARGRGNGSDMGDWFAAERELVRPDHIQVTESGGGVHISADVGGFENIQVGVSPNRLIVWGDAAATSMGERPHLLGEIPLPSSIDPDQATASLREGVLELHAPKAKHAAA